MITFCSLKAGSTSKAFFSTPASYGTLDPLPEHTNNNSCCFSVSLQSADRAEFGWAPPQTASSIRRAKDPDTLEFTVAPRGWKRLAGQGRRRMKRKPSMPWSHHVPRPHSASRPPRKDMRLADDGFRPPPVAVGPAVVRPRQDLGHQSRQIRLAGNRRRLDANGPFAQDFDALDADPRPIIDMNRARPGVLLPGCLERINVKGNSHSAILQAHAERTALGQTHFGRNVTTRAVRFVGRHARVSKTSSRKSGSFNVRPAK